ncbi:hypothetical protein OB905_02885 [Halobacteria archaeon AArc-dxtr1]|nr:hypothetical protein [Halobacteria archaeon AArc-dxtr1]
MWNGPTSVDSASESALDANFEPRGKYSAVDRSQSEQRPVGPFNQQAICISISQAELPPAGTAVAAHLR